MGRSAGSRNVFSRLNTRVMNAPRGLVSANTTSRKNRIWNHPLFVMVRTFPDAASRTRDIRAEPRKRPAKQLCPAFPLPQSVAELDVDHRRYKEDYTCHAKNCVQHLFSSPPTCVKQDERIQTLAGFKS